MPKSIPFFCKVKPLLHIAPRYDTYRKCRLIRTTRVRPGRRRVARYREGGHRRKGKAEGPGIEARREKPSSSRLPRSSSTKNISSSKQSKNRTERQLPQKHLGKCPRDESSPVAQFGAAALSGLGAASTARGGDAAAEAEERDPRKERCKKASARHEPNGYRHKSPNCSLNLDISASLAVALQAETDFMYMDVYSWYRFHFAGRYAYFFLSCIDFNFSTAGGTFFFHLHNETSDFTLRHLTSE